MPRSRRRSRFMPKCRRAMPTSRRFGTRCWRSATMPIFGGGSLNTATTTISSAIARRLKPRLMAFGQGPADRLDRPVDFRADHSHPRSVGAIDQRVRAHVMLDLHDVDFRCWQPTQGVGRIAWPDAPLG